MIRPGCEDQVEHTRSRTWRRPLSEPRDAPLGGSCGDTTELDSRDHVIDIPPRVSLHPTTIHDKEPFQSEERRQQVRRYDTTRP